MDCTAAVTVRNLTMGYGRRIIQKDLNFSIPRGQIVCIMGGSGCGKSTLLKHLIGLNHPVSGDVELLGDSIVKAKGDVRRKLMRRFGVAYQSGALFRSMTVYENIALPLVEFTDYPEEKVRQIVSVKLSQVGLAGFENYMPGDLSGGMVKRVAFARAMALDPEILFFDEPSAGLDPVSSAALDQLILSIRRETGATIMVVTHELASIFTIADRGIMLGADAGGILADGTPEELKNSEHKFVWDFMNRHAPERS
ncbi:MAG: ATP-binding cassette domain-containing protein [Lentisphaeria bacterium]|nr:ATP-binding cassette domain-containing protein [Lentisphaeria bacterium]